MTEKKILDITGMSCTSCANRIEQALNKDESVQEANVNFATKKAYLSVAKNTDINNLINIVKKTGYEAAVIDEASKQIYSVNGMTCSSCALTVEKSLNIVPGVLSAAVNFADKKATLRFENKAVVFSKLSKIVKDAGYELVKVEEQEQKETEHLLKERNRLILAWAITIPLTIKMLFEMFGGLFLISREVAFYMDLVLSFPVIFIIGYPVMRSTFFAVKSFSFNMDSLIGIGTIAAYATGILRLFGLRIENFAVVGAMIMSINFIGNYLKEMATGRASQAIKQLLELGAKSAHMVGEDETITDVPVEELKLDDIVLVKPGEKIPVDGEIIEGETSIDESIATGESIPVDKKAGDKVIGATLNRQGAVKVRIEKIGKDTFLSRIIKMVEEAQGSKIPIQAFADKVTSYFVPVVLIITALTFAFWFFFPGAASSIMKGFENIIPWVNPNRGLVSMALFASIATLVIACPCALGLATPTALMVGMGKGATNGILIRNGEAIQTAQKIDVVVFDKTGTITKGRPTLVAHKSSLEDDEFLKIVGSVESLSEHPLAMAIVNKVTESNIKLLKPEKFEAKTGKGIIAVINGEKVIVGSKRYFDEVSIKYYKFQEELEHYQSQGYTAIFAAMGKEVIGVLGISDEIKDDSAKALEELHKLGIKTAMLTGDNKKSANAIADKVKIDDVYAELMPRDKITIVKKLQDEGRTVAMVGDGINDAPALKQANVGIAIGTGTDIAIESADITLVSGSLTGVVKAIRLSRATFKKILQNLFWAFFYNVVAIPLAVLGLLHPVIAEIAMALSSVNVVGNSLRLKRAKLMSKGE